MKESVWGYFTIVVGIVIIFLVFFFQNITNIDEHNMTLLKSITESSMNDSIDWSSYENAGTLRIDQEAFIESFIRRFAEDAQLASTYKIEFYKVQEVPPLVNIKIYTTTSTSATGEKIDFKLTNTINAILETDPSRGSGGLSTTIVLADDDETYNCELKLIPNSSNNNKATLALYDISNKSNIKQAYIDGEKVETTNTISNNSAQITAYVKEVAYPIFRQYTGNIIYEDGHVALCLIPEE